MYSGGTAAGAAATVPAGRAGRQTVLAERQTVLAEAARLADLARHGAGRLLVITGSSGIGRSALLDAVAAPEVSWGMTVRRAACAPDESGHPHAVARQLSGPGPEFGPDQDGRAPWELLRETAVRRPLLLLVDDVQHADRESADWLRQLARRLHRLPVLLVVTERRDPGPTDLLPPFGAGLPATVLQSRRLAPLSRAGSAELLAGRLGRPVSESLAEECHRATGGLPLLLTALTCPESRPLGAALGPVPTGAFREAVGHWLAGVGEPAATTARTMAELSGTRTGTVTLADLVAAQLAPPVRPYQPYGPAVPDHAGGAGHPELPDHSGWLPDWVQSLRALGLLLPGPADALPEFAHPWLPAALLAGWSDQRRAELHRSAATLLYGRGEPDGVVAEQLMRTEVCGAEWAADVLIGTARQAQREGGREYAVRLLRRALREPLSQCRRGTVLVELGCLEVTLGPPESVNGTRHLAEAVRLHQSDEAVFEAANALGVALAGRGETAAALDVLEDLAERFADRADLAHAVHAATALIASHDGDSWIQVVEGVRRIEARSATGVAPAAYGLLTEFDATSGRLSAAEVSRRVVELTAQPQDSFSASYLTASAATLAQWADRLDLADRLVAEGLTAHRGAKLHPAYQCLLSVRAESRVMRGQFTLLLQELAAASDQRGVLSLGNAHLTSQAVIALAETGHPVQARQLVAAGFEDSPPSGPSSWEMNELVYARGLLHLADGRVTEALADLLDCGRRQLERQVLSPIVTPWRSAAADCHLLLGQVGPAAELAAEELRLARVWDTPRTVGRALRVHGAATGGRQGLATVQEAVQLLRADGLDVELIPALTTLGRLLGGSGQRAAAREALREAVSRAERIGAVRLRGVAADLLLASGAKPDRQRQTGAGALTAGEQRVCRLAVEGNSNPEIAELLHLALRTVETHLTNSFRKLGIRRRAELAGVLEAPEG
ncbi:LuxR C-terminal-related transcriptional regulator [Kitasatospora sp. NPDC096147]|uniref:LuxR C-terminal-related transcriptional regulator n=1 Tax=Kitasatospora sp. NPDC096147 TaxID=3364093 RepID=UPI0037F8935F